MRRLQMLSPCDERFESMKDGHCDRCDKKVLDGTKLEEADVLAAMRAGPVCARLVRQRSTGRVLFGAAALAAISGCSSGAFSGPPTQTVTIVVQHHEKPDAGPPHDYDMLLGDVSEP